MSFNIEITFGEGDSASVVGEGYLPRGVYKFTTTRVYQENSSRGTPMLKFEHQVTEAMILQDDGTYKAEPNFVGRLIKNSQTLPEGKNAEHDGYRRSDILGIMVGHNKLTREQAKNAAGQKLQLTEATFLNQAGQCLYDPPKPGTNGYPRTKYLDQEIFTKIVGGQLQPNWPQDKEAAKTNAARAAGGTSGGMTTGAGNLLGAQQGFGGLPGGAPVAGAPAAPTAPATPGDAVTAFGGGAAPTPGGWS
jgi:hypothetical protein